MIFVKKVNYKPRKGSWHKNLMKTGFNPISGPSGAQRPLREKGGLSAKPQAYGQAASQGALSLL